jgi:hypothetical protein
MDIRKYQIISAFNGVGGKSDFERQMVRKQAISEFDIYQQYSPNSHMVYINDNPTPILATFQDVSDLEVRADTKWMATSLDNKVCAGDIVTWNVNGKYSFDSNGRVIGRKWLVIYDKEKNTANSYKVKIQPCNYAIKFPFYKEDGTPSIYIADSIIMTYLTDSKDFKQPFPTETGTTFASVPYNDITSRIYRQDRIWLFDDAFEVGGVDFTNIDFYVGKGFLKWTLRPNNTSSDLDRKDLGICDYYKIFPKPTTTIPVTPNPNLTISASSTKLNTFSKMTINATAIGNVLFIFDGENIGCTLTNMDGKSCVINVGGEVGIVYVKAYLESDPTVSQRIRFIISNS